MPPRDDSPVDVSESETAEDVPARASAGPEGNRLGIPAISASLGFVEWARCIAPCAGLKVFAAGVALLLPGVAPARTLPAGLVVLQFCTYGGAGVILVVAHARDSRTAYLGGMLLIVASSFAGAAVSALALRAEALSWLTPIYPDACLPLFLARFIEVFPRRAPQSWQARTLRVARVARPAGVVLLVLNVLVGWGLTGGNRWVVVFQRRSAGGTAYWTVVFVLILASLLVALTSAPMLAPDERRRVRWFWISFSLGFGPATLAIVAGAIPGDGARFTAWMMRGWLSTTLELLLATVPITVAYAVLVQRMLPLRIVVRQAMQYLFARWTISAGVVTPLVWLTIRKCYRH